MFNKNDPENPANDMEHLIVVHAQLNKIMRNPKKVIQFVKESLSAEDYQAVIGLQEILKDHFGDENSFAVIMVTILLSKKYSAKGADLITSYSIGYAAFKSTIDYFFEDSTKTEERVKQYQKIYDTLFRPKKAKG
jgi:hypothetical protein